MAQIALNYSAAQINAAIAKITTLISVIEGSIVQLYDGSTAIYPRTKAEAVFFNNDTSKTLDQQFSQLEQEQIQGGVYDVSAHNDSAVFESLQALLSSSNLSTLIPTSVRHGGMSIRFIQGSVPDSDNKYIQARCMAQNFTTDVTQWQGVDDEPTAGSDNLVKSGGVDKIINGSSVIQGSSFEMRNWYTHTSIGEPLILNTLSSGSAYKGLIPQNTYSINIFGSGGTGGRLWYTLDAEENVVRMSKGDVKSDSIIIQDGEVYIVAQTNSATNYPGKIIFYSNTGINLKIEQLQENLNEIQNNLYDEIFNVSELAEYRAWYIGTSIGEEIQKVSASNCYAIKHPVQQGETYTLSAKGSGGRGWYMLDSENIIVDLAPINFNDTITLEIPEGVAYLIIQSNAGLSYLALLKLGDINTLKTKTNELQEDVEQLQQSVKTDDTFKCITPFLWNKLSRIKNLATGFCNIGFIGDSWTQGTSNSIDGVSQKDYQGYVRPLTKMLQDEYGYGGLGWLDFARDHGTGKMFGCAEMYEHWNYQFAGTVTGLDGSDSGSAENCLGICCAHTIFANAATLTLTFNAGYLDKFKIRYYKDAHFSISINGGAAVEITANSTDRWQETEFGVTGTDITRVVITSLADDTIIFGIDCFYGTKGVRCHKIGNRSIQAGDYLLMDATQWEEGINLLDLSWASVMLAINDLGGSTSESKMNTIVNNISSLIDRIKVATDDGNGLVTCDLNLLGIDNIEASGYAGLGALAKKQKEMALQSGYGWCSTDKCIGSKKDEFVYTGTFSDTIHLNSIGSYAYAKHIYNSLFTF